MMPRRNTPPLNAFVLFLLFSTSGLFLFLTIREALAMSIFWTLLGFLVARTSWISGNAPSGLESNKGLLYITTSYICSVVITSMLIYEFGYLSSSLTNNQQSAFINSPYVIQSLLSFWTLIISYLLAGFIRSYKEAIQKGVIAPPKSIAAQVSLPLAQPLSESALPYVTSAKKRWIIPDITTLEDGRAFDIAKLGLFDGFFALPSFVIKDLKAQAAKEIGDESPQSRSKRALDTIRRLETLPKLAFEIIDETNFNEGQTIVEKLYAYAQSTNSSLLTLDPSLYRFDNDEGDSHCVISLDAIASAVKQPIPKGDYLSIKIQRLGKEPKQGIGYLDDGTMVVVNGGGDFLGKVIKTQVLSQKYSSSGKIIFCNAVSLADEELVSSTSSSF